MGYDIFYNKQFVRLQSTGEVIPMVLAGSNNCYESGVNGRSGRRSRDWQVMSHYNGGHSLSAKPATILANVDAALADYTRRYSQGEDKAEPGDIRKRFGWYTALAVGSGSCGATSFSRWRSLFSNGIKDALTIEELDKLGVHVMFEASYYTKPPPVKPPYAYLPPMTEAGYFAELSRWQDWQKRAGGYSFHLTFSPVSTDEVLHRLLAARRRPVKPKTPVHQDHYFVLVNDQGALLRYTSRGYRYSHHTPSGKRFLTEKAAETYRKHIVDRKLHHAETWAVKRIDQPCTG